jgi:hypothetical protein
MPHLTVDQFTYVVKVAGGVGSFVAFCIVVSTYYRTERWKLAEFLANEMKEFFASAGVQKAMLLIDWGKRRIRLLENVPDDQAISVVTRPMQVRGLRPHVLVTANESDSDTMVVKDGADSDRFTQPEAAIRDCYDAFLDGLERFGSYTKTGLTDVASLRPYIGYWIDDLSNQQAPRTTLPGMRLPASSARNCGFMSYSGAPQAHESAPSQETCLPAHLTQSASSRFFALSLQAIFRY